MAGNTINMDLKLQDSTGSIKARLNDVKALNKELDRSTSGRSVSAPYVRAGLQPGETKTSRSIGDTAGTGSATSDFAAQAQGLGGLVHVYATFAANLFAVSSAFGALSKAMDTANLVKGLDQIGAASGKNLGSLADQMVKVSDGALSMQQAMTSTAMASASGMSSKDILRMTEVAKKASLALGRDIPDSMDRLTKGIAKTQPELLDELGIMTRMIPAQQDYAKQIGKTVGELTEFEKRQAFANAVLAEGEKKFSSIDLASNPYTKVLASIKNIAQDALQVVNSVLAPLVNILASSPVGLTMALGSFAAILLKQAIPAIGMFRENAKRMAEETHIRVKQQIEEQRDAASQSDIIAARKAEREYVIAGEGAKKLEQLRKAQFSSLVLGREVRGLLKKNPLELTEEESNKILAKHSELYDKITKGIASKEESDQFKKLDVRKEKIVSLVQDIAKVGDAAAHANELQDSKWWSHQEQKERYLKQLESKAAKRAIISTAADNAAIMGPSYAFSKLREDVKELDSGKLSKIGTTIKGTFAIASSAVSTAINAFGMWGQAIAAAGVAISILDGYLSTSKKQAEEYNTTLNTVESSFDNIDRTIDVIKKKDFLEQMSIASTQARATAFGDLSDNLTDVISKFDKLVYASSAWDNAKDRVLDMFGQGRGDKLSVALSNSIVSAIKVMEEGPAKETAKAALSNILGQSVDLSNFKEINQLIKDLDETEISSKGKAIDTILKNASREANNAASSLTTFKNTLADIGKQKITQTNKLIPTDDFSKIGMLLGDAAKSLNDALKDPIQGLKALSELAKDTQTLSFLPPDLAVSLGNATKNMDLALSTVNELQQDVSDTELKITNAQKILAEETKGTWDDAQIRYTAQKVLDTEITRIGKVKERLALEKEGIDKLQQQYKNVGISMTQISFDYLAKGLKTALQEAAIISAKGYLEVLKAGGVGTADTEHKIAQAEFKVQEESIKASFELIRSEQNLKISIDALALSTERSNLLAEQERLIKSGASVSSLDRLQEKLNANTAALEDVKKKNLIINMNPKALAADIKSGKMSPVTADAMKTMPGYEAQLLGQIGLLSKIGAASGAESFTNLYKTFAEQQDQQKKIKANEISILETDKARLLIAEKLSSTYQDSISTSILQKDLDILKAKNDSDNLEFSKQQYALDLAKSKASKDDLAKIGVAQSILDATKSASQSKYYSDRLALEEAAQQKQEEGIRKLNEMYQSFANKRADAENAHSISVISTNLEDLDYQYSIGNLSEAEFTRQNTLLKLKAAELDYETKIRAVVADKGKELADATSELEKQKTYNATHAPSSDRRVRQGTMEIGTPVDTKAAESRVENAKAGLVEGVQAANDARDATINGINKVAQAVMDKGNWAAGAKKSLTEYADTANNVFDSTKNVMTNAFKGMENALVDFVTKGKLSFGDLADSIISDLVRIAVQKSITGPLAAAFGSFFAQGGAFNGGVQMFAKGGAFTNSVVTSPTLFKFAQGTGLMGEAGPEAIMPLKRDNNGNLGVRASSGNVGNSVTINVIESKDKAGTQERTTDNGVDVVNVFVDRIKNAIAGDIVKGSGIMSTALNRTYGLNRVAGAY